MQETQSGWRSFPSAAAEWRLLELTAPATASADSVWPLRASMERFVFVDLDSRTVSLLVWYFIKRTDNFP